MNKVKIFFLVVFFMVIGDRVNAQGCSDAGFCTINSIKPSLEKGTAGSKNQIKVGVSYGSADNSISVFGNYIEYNRTFNDKFGMDVKLTALSQSGNSISIFGLSDAFLNANYQLNKRVKLILGTKIPFSNGNAKKNGLALPMDYQASLGTFDLILGMGYEMKKLQLVLALQQPLTQNSNRFFAENYPVGSKLRSFQTTNQFKRSGDLLCRISYPIALNKKLTCTPGLLPIYHIRNDRYTDIFNMEREIKGSAGLTLNGNIYFDYMIDNKNALQFNAGAPLVVRDTRPDGLTRGFVANLEYRIKF